MANTRILLLAGCLIALVSAAESTLNYRRKPILTYLLRYHLGQLKAKAHSLGGLGGLAGHGLPHHGHGEEHIHHYYIEPIPYGAVPLGPPTILPGGLGHAPFSLHNPHFGGDLNYQHYWGLNQPLNHLQHL